MADNNKTIVMVIPYNKYRDMLEDGYDDVVYEYIYTRLERYRKGWGYKIDLDLDYNDIVQMFKNVNGKTFEDVNSFGEALLGEDISDMDPSIRVIDHLDHIGGSRYWLKKMGFSDQHIEYVSAKIKRERAKTSNTQKLLNVLFPPSDIYMELDKEEEDFIREMVLTPNLISRCVPTKTVLNKCHDKICDAIMIDDILYTEDELGEDQFDHLVEHTLYNDQGSYLLAIHCSMSPKE